MFTEAFSCSGRAAGNAGEVRVSAGYEGKTRLMFQIHLRLNLRSNKYLYCGFSDIPKSQLNPFPKHGEGRLPNGTVSLIPGLTEWACELESR